MNYGNDNSTAGLPYKTGAADLLHLVLPAGIENYAKAHYNKYNLVYSVHIFYGKECEMHAGSF